ncbi:hypothetical protein [Sphaerospermopsis kisseleviana]
MPSGQTAFAGSYSDAVVAQINC